VRAFQLGSGLAPTGGVDASTLDALGLSDANLAYLEATPRHYESWMPVMKFKHGKWKVKWKKYRRHGSDEYGDWDRAENGDEHGYVPDED
jgi:hypothetical protein